MRVLVLWFFIFPVFMFGQATQLPVEDSICQCMQRAFAARGVDLASEWQAFEADLVKRAYLDEASQRYPELLQSIAEAEYFDLRRSEAHLEVALAFADVLQQCYQQNLFRSTDALLFAKITEIITAYPNLKTDNAQVLTNGMLGIYLKTLERADYEKSLYKWLVLWNLLIVSIEDTSGQPRQFPEEKITLPEERLLPVFANKENRLMVNGSPVNLEELRPMLIQTFERKDGVKLISERETDYGFYLEVYRFIQQTHQELLDEAAVRFDKIYEQLPPATQYAIRQELPFVLVEAGR